MFPRTIDISNGCLFELAGIWNRFHEKTSKCCPVFLHSTQGLSNPLQFKPHLKIKFSGNFLNAVLFLQTLLYFDTLTAAYINLHISKVPSTVSINSCHQSLILLFQTTATVWIYPKNQLVELGIQGKKWAPPPHFTPFARPNVVWPPLQVLHLATDLSKFKQPRESRVTSLPTSWCVGWELIQLGRRREASFWSRVSAERGEYWSADGSRISCQPEKEGGTWASLPRSKTLLHGWFTCKTCLCPFSDNSDRTVLHYYNQLSGNKLLALDSRH